MTDTIELYENELAITIAITDEGDVRLLNFSAIPLEPDLISDERAPLFRLVEIQLTGEDRDSHHGSKYTGTMPGKRLRYIGHRDMRNSAGRKWEIDQKDEKAGLFVTSHLQFFDGIPVVRAWTEVANRGEETVTLEYLSSFALTGLAKRGAKRWDTKMRLALAHNTCFGEAQWRSYTLPEIGLTQVGLFSVRRFDCTSSGTWSSSQFLPVGTVENQESGERWMWQIEHNGSWHWEISDHMDQLYIQLSGPTDQEHQWYKHLAPGTSFTSVPIAVCAVQGAFDLAAAAMTHYRRRIRRPNQDNIDLPVIFNDYMNCLWANPSTEKLEPLIDAAARVGCEYFCIDAGWFSEDFWWSSVGEWLPAQKRFTHGLMPLLQRIRDRGMVPGLWVEIEVMGVDCPLAKQWPDDCFFCRHGKRVIDHGRYQLDFRHPQVIAHANATFARLVEEFGVGYIKIDYNINAGIGTDVQAESAGAGLLEHNRAYLNWLDEIFARYPHITIENCSSGGMRMDYALLSRHSIQSSSDQDDYRLYAPIASACLSALTPEQCAAWSYPLASSDREAVIFNMINALLMRIHLSGQLATLSDEQFALVEEAIVLYKQIRRDIPHGLPFWALGLPTMDAPWVSLGLDCGERIYLAVWRRNSVEPTCEIQLPDFLARNTTLQASCIYPAKNEHEWKWNAEKRTLDATLPDGYSARLFCLTLGHTQKA